MRERMIRAIAGTIVLISVLLAFYVNMNWLLLTAFVGANLLQSSISKWCLMDDILRKVFKVKS
ncbi:YgaP family membrane protein [Marinifilum sp.]|uniref:YgaP family membrane protein n=1 Tax=Marinifilum sp. TaxID=2033137 RepID=UPI003BAC2516